MGEHLFPKILLPPPPLNPIKIHHTSPHLTWIIPLANRENPSSSNIFELFCFATIAADSARALESNLGMETVTFSFRDSSGIGDQEEGLAGGTFWAESGKSRISREEGRDLSEVGSPDEESVSSVL